MFHPLTLENLFFPLNITPHIGGHSSLSKAGVRPSKKSARLHEESDAYTLNISLIDLVGRRFDELELSVESDILTLEIPALPLANRKELTPLFEELPTKAKTSRYRLPRHIEQEQIEARLHGQELMITLPKKQALKVPINIVND